MEAEKWEREKVEKRRDETGELKANRESGGGREMDEGRSRTRNEINDRR